MALDDSMGSPTDREVVKATVRGIRRIVGVASKRKANPGFLPAVGPEIRR